MKSDPVRNLVPDHRSRSASPVWLTAVKAAHTIVWVFFVACILEIPFAAWRGEHRVAGWMTAVVTGEVFLLAVNGWRCPMTSVAGRFTAGRCENFDIYLPVWLAKHNNVIFGALYVVGVAFAFVQWVRASGQSRVQHDDVMTISHPAHFNFSVLQPAAKASKQIIFGLRAVCPGAR